MGTYRYRSKIKVVYANGDTARISPSQLDALIAAQRVDQFERSDGWAEVGIDATRGMGGPSYAGRDRRLG